MVVWWNATLYPFAQVQQSNPYWIHAWQWSTHRAHPPSFFGFNPDTPDETFLRWIFGTTSEVCSSLASPCWQCWLSAAASAAHFG
jgi:hypothetical protein